MRAINLDMIDQILIKYRCAYAEDITELTKLGPVVVTSALINSAISIESNDARYFLAIEKLLPFKGALQDRLNYEAAEDMLEEIELCLEAQTNMSIYDLFIVRFGKRYLLVAGK